MDVAGKMRELINDEKFEEAFELGKDPLADPSSYTAVMGALKELTAELRHACMLMAVKKMDFGREYFSKEELLEKACKLVGEDIYGNRLL